MKIQLEHRPSVIVVLVDSQYRPLPYSLKLVRDFQHLAESYPTLPLLVSLYGNLKHVEISSLDWWNEKAIHDINI